MAPKAGKRPYNVNVGKALRGHRMIHGFDRAEDFAPAVERATGLKLSLDTLRRIECGRQPMNVEQYAAIYETLYGEPQKLFCAD